MICCCGLFHFQRVPESAAWPPPSLDAITPCLMECLLFVMRDHPVRLSTNKHHQLNITSADTIRLQRSEVLTVQCSRANEGSGQKKLTLQPNKKGRLTTVWFAELEEFTGKESAEIRSYWIACSPSEQRFAKGSEENHMDKYDVGLKKRLEEYLLKSTESLQDTAARDFRVANRMEALERLRVSNPFDRAN